MLACLPASGDPTVRLLSRTQMNTGLQKCRCFLRNVLVLFGLRRSCYTHAADTHKENAAIPRNIHWFVPIAGETTQKMRSASCPTPAELDAYAKKVANNPLTIQIFPNSVKVPQRKHIRRTVNGLDTSSSSQRHSPYPSQVTSSGGLLAVLRVPAKGVIKESDGSRTRQLQKAAMNSHSGPYATQSTLNLSQPVPHLQGPSQPMGQAAQKQGMVHPQALQQQQQQQSMTRPMTLQQPPAMPLPPALQQRNMAHGPSLQQAQNSQQQKLVHPAGRPQSLPHSQALQQPQSQPQPHLSHLQTLQHQAAPSQALLTQQGVTQDLRRMSDGAQLPSLQHTQGLLAPQAVGAGPPSMANSLQQPPPGAYGPRKPPDADAPPNVTVSTSTIPLSMAASLHQNRPSDLSSIVHQINQLCQARAGMGSTSVCEGQIANPSPISRNLLINASSRVSSHYPALSSVPSCLMAGPSDKATAQTASAALHSQPTLASNNCIPAFHTDPEKVQLQQQQQLQHHLQKQQLQQQQQHLLQLQQQRSWAQHQMAHMQQPPEGAHPCKNPRMEPPTDCSFPSRNLTYSHKLPSAAASSFPLKHPAEKPPAASPVGSLPYNNGHYVPPPPWGNMPAGAATTGPQDLPVAFQGGPAAGGAERVLGAKYRPGKEAPADPAKLMHNVDYLGGDFHMSSFQEQNMGLMHRSAMGQGQEPGSGGHAHHPGYC